MTIFKLSKSWGRRFHGYFLFLCYWTRWSEIAPWRGWWSNFYLSGSLSLLPPSVQFQVGPILLALSWPRDSRPVWERQPGWWQQKSVNATPTAK